MYICILDSHVAPSGPRPLAHSTARRTALLDALGYRMFLKWRGNQQPSQQHASQQSRQTPKVQIPPRLGAGVSRAGQATTTATAGEPAEQATTMATAGEPAEQAGTKSAEAAMLVRKKCAGQGRPQQWQHQAREQQRQQQASQQGKQAPKAQTPPCLCTKVCRVGQATTMATAGEPAEQAGTTHRSGT